MHFRNDPEKHQRLTEELLSVLKDRGFRVLSADGIEGVPPVRRLHNDGFGDQEDKAPDIYAFDDREGCYIIGEAKTGDNDFESDHALTQYNVFLDQFEHSTGRQAVLYIIVPSSKVPEFNSLITHYIHRDYWGSLVLVSSKTVVD
jgi:hypothetical protein